MTPAIPGDRSLICPDYGPGVTSLLGVLREQLASMPDRPVCHRIVRQPRGLLAELLTVAALVDRAGRVAATLRATGVGEDDRVILSFSDPHEFLVAFVGVLMAGAGAVPLPSTAEVGAPLAFAARVRTVCLDCAPSAAIVESADRFGAVMGAVPAGLKVLELRAMEQATDGMALENAPANRTAFIQYTSGSTGTPKGVVVTQGNLLANCRAIRDATGYSRADRMVSWLPLHHDMGLVGGLLTSIYCAAETWLLPPMQFLARPVVWLEAITTFGATLTVGPTFAYALCARRIPDKQLAGVRLSTLRLAYIGAEPIHPATVDAFTRRFGAYGLSPQALYPVYGLAEATLAVTFPAPGNAIRYDHVDRRRLAGEGVAHRVAPGEPDAVRFVSVGRPLPGVQVDVVSPESGVPVPERRLGEIVVTGASVSPGYFATAGFEPRERLHTGDLAYVADGEVYVVDRLKDLVVIAGQNYAPSDIENAAADVVGLRRGRLVAFSLPGDVGTEALYVVAEVSPDSWRAPREIEDDVKRRVREGIGLSPADVVLVPPGTLERTSSGKIKRRACVEAFRDGGLARLRHWPDVLASRVARRRDRLGDHAGRVGRGLLEWVSSRGSRDE